MKLLSILAVGGLLLMLPVRADQPADQAFFDREQQGKREAFHIQNGLNFASSFPAVQRYRLKMAEIAEASDRYAFIQAVNGNAEVYWACLFHQNREGQTWQATAYPEGTVPLSKADISRVNELITEAYKLAGAKGGGVDDSLETWLSDGTVTYLTVGQKGKNVYFAAYGLDFPARSNTTLVFHYMKPAKALLDQYTKPKRMKPSEPNP